MKPVRFCLVGTGRAGVLHARNLVGKIPEAALTVLCDTHQKSLQNAGQELGIPTLLTDYTKAISREDVDAVVIVTPTFLHREMACCAARHGKHVFLEKPMALNAAECAEIQEAVDQAGVKLQIGFMRRFDTSFQQAKAIIESGELGRVMIVKSTGRGPGGPGKWMYDLRKSNGIIAEVNSHDLDTLRWLAGQEFAQVYAQGRNFKCPDARAEWPDFYDNVVAQFSFDQEAMGIVDGTCPAHYGYDARVEVLGERGMLQIGQVQEPGLTKVSVEGQISRCAVKSWRNLFKDAYLAEMEHFVVCIRENKSPRVTGTDGLEAVKAVNAVNESIRSGQPASINQESRA
jgi:myo-inositol 2-dehydrogenase/D-chiro-inositol 1-dehydrogenase/scyllo-inositol 2-dehydrogenase (NAD+)